MVTQVNVGLPRSQGLIAHLGFGKHDLQPLTVGSLGKPVLQAGETQFAGIADKDDTSADGDLIGGLLARCQGQLPGVVGVFLTNLDQGVVA